MSYRDACADLNHNFCFIFLRNGPLSHCLNSGSVTESLNREHTTLESTGDIILVNAGESNKSPSAEDGGIRCDCTKEQALSPPVVPGVATAAPIAFMPSVGFTRTTYVFASMNTVVYENLHVTQDDVHYQVVGPIGQNPCI
ncbi:hypothetical protein P692DRAFT_20883795 [Suillus brevipes Sb2]|nr:hypothetical protein P692DRAFT_20883795 [Suillus brevipes Sb2]